MCVCVSPAYRCHSSTHNPKQHQPQMPWVYRHSGYLQKVLLLWYTETRPWKMKAYSGKLTTTKKSKETEGIVELCTETLLLCCLALLADLVEHLPARSTHVKHDTCPLYRLCGIMCSPIFLCFTSNSCCILPQDRHTRAALVLALS